MDPTRDNPVIRFTTFWWALGAFLIFTLLLAAILLIGGREPASLDDAAAVPRYEIKARVDDEQAAALPPEAIESAMPAVAARLAAAKPVAVEKPEHVVPGSPTAQRLAEAAPVDTTAIDAPPEDPGAPVDPAVMEIGQVQYMLCAVCHGPEGEGSAIGPPLAGSEWVTGPVSNLIRIQLRGLKGPITVKGVEYSFPGGMIAMPHQTDEQIAAVLTYVRNSFGNEASAVTPDQVAALRGEVGMPQVTVDDLVQP